VIPQSVVHGCLSLKGGRVTLSGLKRKKGYWAIEVKGGEYAETRRKGERFNRKQIYNGLHWIKRRRGLRIKVVLTRGEREIKGVISSKSKEKKRIPCLEGGETPEPGERNELTH